MSFSFDFRGHKGLSLWERATVAPDHPRETSAFGSFGETTVGASVEHHAFECGRILFRSFGGSKDRKRCVHHVLHLRKTQAGGETGGVRSVSYFSSISTPQAAWEVLGYHYPRNSKR